MNVGTSRAIGTSRATRGKRGKRGKRTGKTILAFPYHDPHGTYNEAFRKQLGDMRQAFGPICVSATPTTIEQNRSFIEELEERGCVVYRNPPGSTLGDHFRQALRSAVHASGGSQRPVYFGFIDRILFAFETQWRDRFLEDLCTCQDRALVTFERTPYAWDTHPTNYREIEQMVSRVGEWLLGTNIEFGLCGLLVSPSTAELLATRSISSSCEVLGEWILLAAQHGIPIAAKRVDWVLWEDPYWEGIDPEVLRRQREQSADETIKRVRMNVPFMSLLAEERFKGLILRVERI